MTQAFFHRQQNVGVAAGLDVDHPVRVQPGKAERWREKIAPAQAPENRTVDTCENAREENGRRGVIAEFGAAGDFVEGATGKAASGKVAVERI